MLSVEVAYAMPERQWLKALTLEEGATVGDAILASGLSTEIGETTLRDATVGIWGKEVARSARLKSGDRVEIYRPLLLDPREARRQLAMLGQTMTSKSSK